MVAGAKEHVPVLVDEVETALAVRADGLYLDATFGRGGHSRALLASGGPRFRLLALDRDPAAVAVAEEMAQEDSRVNAIAADFRNLGEELSRRGLLGALDGALFDLGVSSPQLDDAERGFSFRRNGPLDMRMNPSEGMPAHAWINSATPADIARVLRRYGEERHARRIAQAVSERRKVKKILTTGELADVVASVMPRGNSAIHPATRTFQAIRIFVNDELAALREGLAHAFDGLKGGGRMCVISFHSLEDRIVKRFMRDASRVDPALAGLPEVPASARPVAKLHGRAIRPDQHEIDTNPRARSAILRTVEKLA
jgi:16S rRNA (cytosine1402-N4)-methyltransferase